LKRHYSLIDQPNSEPAKIVFALPPSSAGTRPGIVSSPEVIPCDATGLHGVAAAFKTSAHRFPRDIQYAVLFTMSARRKGIIIRIPRRPPSTETSAPARSPDRIQIMIAGHGAPTPKTRWIHRRPAVCTMLFLKNGRAGEPSLESSRTGWMAITATGIDALTVRPTFSTRYSERPRR